VELRTQNLRAAGRLSWQVAAAVATFALAASAFAANRTPMADEPATGASAAGAEEADPLFDDVEAEPPAYPDPFERFNRSTHRFNVQVDRLVVEPVTNAYTVAVPDPARQTVRRVFSNLNSPAVIMNDLLQGELDAFAVALARFTVNTTVGVGGLFDPATGMGLEEHRTDFGQTLAVAGIGSGPFLVLPVLGPTTVRDGVGTVVDFFFRPTTYVTFGTDQLIYAGLEAGGGGFATREEHNEGLKALRASSIDYYAALRNAYFQSRTAELRERIGPPAEAPTGPVAAATDVR
jgi:phospholipid-binding lipoprotein MlaA